MKQILIFAIAIAGFLFSPAAWGQDDNQHQIDSLRKEVDAAKGDAKFEAYLQWLALTWADADLNRKLAIMEEIETEARRQNNIAWQTIPKVNILLALQDVAQWDEIYKRAPGYLAFLQEKERWEDYYTAANILVDSYLKDNKNNTALRKASEMYDFAKQRQHNFGMASAAYAMGLAYSVLERNGEAQKQFEKCIEFSKKEGHVTHQMLNAYFWLCETLQMQLLFDEELVRLKEMEQAIDGFEKLHNIVLDLNRVDLLSLYANMYIQMGDFEKADSCCTELETLIPGDLQNTSYFRSKIFIHQKQYPQALENINIALQENSHSTTDMLIGMMRIKAEILAEMNMGMEAYAVCDSAYQMADSVRTKDINAQLDELRTQYEVDRHIEEKLRNRNYFLFALTGCALLAVALGIWIYYGRKIDKKNRALAQQIHELVAQQERNDAELLNKTSFVGEEEYEDNNGICPESRKDRLCIAIRDIILKEKAYLNPTLTRDYVIERLGTSRNLFVDAFQSCFGMSFTEYINHLRMKDAIILLEQSDLSIEDISVKTGFGTLRTFQRQFQKKYNLSPKDYRNSVKEAMP